MADKLKKLDVLQPMNNFDGTPLAAEGKPITLQTCLGIILNGDHTDLPITEQSEINKTLIKVALADKPVFLTQSQYDALKKLCDKPRPSSNPFITQVSVCVPIREMVNAAESVEDFAAT